MLTPADAALVQRDRGLSGLALLLDSDRFVDVLRQSLPDARLEKAETTYLRYKPKTSCLAGFRLVVSGTPVEVHAKAYMPAGRDRMLAALAQPSTVGVLGPGRFALTDAVVVSVFPNDAELESLTPLADATARQSLLRKMLPERPDLWDGVLRTIRYKPERRYVGQLLAGTGAPAASLKLYCEQEFSAAQANSKVFTACGFPAASRRLGRSGRHRLIALEWVPGLTLSEVIADPKLGGGAARQAGRTLAQLHTQRPKRLPLLPRNAEASSLQAVAADLGTIYPPVAERAARIARQIAARLESCYSGYAPIHGDFYAKQIVLAGDRATILDLDQAVLSDPAADLGLFLAHLERDAMLDALSGNQLRTLGEDFLAGYQEVAGPVDARWIDLYTAVGLLRLAPEPFRHREPEWPDRTEMLLGRAETLLVAQPPFTSIHTTGAAHMGKAEQAVGVRVVDPYGVDGSPEMPFLSRAIDPVEVHHQLARRLPALFDGERRVRLIAIQVTRHKPGRRCLIRYDLEVERSGALLEVHALLGKARARGLDQSTFRTQRMLWNAGFDSGSGDCISVPEPLAMIPEFQMWLQRKVSGGSATEEIAGPGGIALSVRLAEAIHKLHRAGIPARRRHTIVDELRILHERLPIVSQANPQWSGRIERLLGGCYRLGASLPQPELRGIHRDFYADQVLVDGSRMYLLDFDLYCEGDPALDVGNFLGHMTEQALRTVGDAGAFEQQEAAMAERFVELSGELARPSIHAYKTLTLARQLYLSTQLPGRGICTEALLELCEHRLAAQRN